MSDPHAMLSPTTNERQEMSNEILSPVRFGVCATCDSAENIVWSGVDAFLLGVTTGFACYTCANGGYEYIEEAL